MTPSAIARALTALALSATAAACGSRTDSSAAPVELPLVTLGEPLLEIGVVDGAEAYTFAALETVVRRTDGAIAVSDAGSTRISVFGTDGAFVRAWGQQGDGPGEFRSLSRIYALPGDSLMAAERADGRVAVFDASGELSREARAESISGDTLFALDSWLYGRYWVEGALTATERARVKATLASLPVPRAGAGYRVIRIDEDGRLWARTPGAPTGAVVTWTRLGVDGRPEAVVETPARFQPTWIDGDEMLGVWRGEADVHFVRAYRLEETDQTRPVPGWLTGGESSVTREVAPDEGELLALMRNRIKNMASAQEIHYASNMTYTPRIEELERFEAPEELVIDFVRGDNRGWGAVFSHPSLDRLCALAYGFNVPPGWTPGMVLCAPEAVGPEDPNAAAEAVSGEGG